MKRIFKDGPLTEDAGLVILCQNDSGEWRKVFSPSFTCEQSAYKWIKRQLEFEELPEDSEYFVARRLSLEDLKDSLGIKNG